LAPEGVIHFHEVNTSASLSHPHKIKTWVIDIIRQHGYRLTELNFIFCNDDYLYRINQQYLNHHYYTDVITFDNADRGGTIEGDIFISISQVAENAQQYNTAYLQELHRVMIHGVLHLLGYRDHTEPLQQTMRKKETECLKVLED
jgi:rRNA maturation RNase YbeY